MRQVADGLHRLAEFGVFDFVQEQREDDGEGEGKHQRHDIQQHGVSDQLREVHAVDEIGKMLEAHELAAREALEQLVIVKRDAQVPHGDVADDHEIRHDGQDHQVHVPVHPDAAADIFSAGRGENGMVFPECLY